MDEKQIIWLIIGLAVGVCVVLVRRALRRQVFTKTKSFPACTPETHEWRGVAAPYAVQCRKCGAAKFALDEKGNFPEGLREYMQFVRTAPLNPVEIPKPQWICDGVINGVRCGAQMSVKTACDKCGWGMVRANLGTDPSKEVWFCKKCGNTEEPNTGLGPLYVCPVCESWRKISYV